MFWLFLAADYNDDNYDSDNSKMLLSNRWAAV